MSNNNELDSLVVTREQAIEMLKTGELTRDEFPVEVHWFVTGKGGCLKTTSAAYFFQYKHEHYSGEVSGIDLDQSNSSFYQYGVRQPEFRIEKVNVFDETQTRIEERRFDVLVSKIEDSLESLVIDNGASTYLELVGYLKTSGIMYNFDEFGYPQFFHCPVTGVDALGYCLKDIEHIVNTFEEFQSVKFCIWLHKNHGDLEVKGQSIMNTENMQEISKRLGDRLIWVDMPKFDLGMTNVDVQLMLKNNLTFEATQAVEIQKKDKKTEYSVKVSPWGLNSVQRSRLRRAKNDVFQAIQAAGL